MEFKAVAIKKFFKEKFNIPVRTRKVAVKNPFFQVWIENQEKDHRKPLRYEHEFPADLGTLMLKKIYGEHGDISFPAGNIQRHSLSFHQGEWDHLVAHYTA